MSRYIIIMCSIVIFSLVCSISLADAIHTAAGAGDNAAVKRLIKVNKSYLQAKDTNGLTPLHYASHAEQIETIEILMSLGADVNAADNNGSTALHYAAAQGNMRAYALLRTKGAKADIKNQGGFTASDYAYDYGCKHIVDLAEKGDIARVKALVSSDKRLVKVSDSGRKTALHQAAYFGHNSVVKYLLASGADPNAEANMRGTPLHLAVMGQHLDTVKMLLAAGADPNIQDAANNYPVYQAISDGNAEIIKVLKAAGAKVDENKRPLNKLEKDFLKSLQLRRHDAIAKALKANPGLAKFVTPNGTSRNGISPIHIAASQGDITTMKLLISKGADVNHKRVPYSNSRVGIHTIHFPEGCTPLYIAMSLRNWDAASLLLKNGAAWNSFAVLHFGTAQQFKSMMAKHPEFVKDTLGEDSTLVHWAVNKKKTEALHQLISLGADVNARTSDAWETPLHWAARINAVEETALLLKAGVDINAGSEFGATPLLEAASAGSYEAVQILLKNGANPNIAESYSTTLPVAGVVIKTPLSVALSSGHKKVAELIRKYGGKTVAELVKK